ncbi:sensor histidine kinase [Alkalihalobacterium elongatum]|uniref:sensor histidine kinase n=1 Tax=Alkalihalobacterium elongatum TaxID=2675466 RepID=UPI002E29012F|nr:HAMP domain-containing sensor histidine kinase [Alkalihalobacterium elongatum]
MKFSIKLGLWFFICILVIESVSMLFLHKNVVHSLVNEELHSLQARGNSHRDVLEMSYTSETLHHIAMMETQTDTEVVITNLKGSVVEASRKIDPGIQYILEIEVDAPPRNGYIIQADWKDQQYISTVSPFDDGAGNQGYVYMLKSNDHIQAFIAKLNHHFLIAIVLILVFLLVTIIFLLKVLTSPLVSMKEATKKLSNGDFSVTVPVMSNDEIGELSKSIQLLANDLSYLKKERNEFLASISHELRTPLTYIKGYADIGKRKTITEEERINYMNIIHEESENVHQLLHELFELAKIDENMFTIQKMPINIKDFLFPIYEKARHVFLAQGHQLELVCRGEWRVEIDPRRFEQIILNLLDNALKYSSEKSLTKIDVYKENQEILIAISDQGQGIPSEDLPYVFNRLFRVDKSRSRLTGGFGLGLAIVKEIVEAHSARISVDSEFGEGTCFTIRLKESFHEDSFTH